MAGTKFTAVGPRLHSQKGQWMLSIPIEDEVIIASAQRILKKQFKRQSDPLDHLEKVKRFLSLHFLPKEQEQFACLFLDSQYQVIAFETLFYGSIDTSAVYPREVVKAALKHNSAALMVVHNHPSGSHQPSQPDIEITRQLKHALQIVDITLLDHFIVGIKKITSLADNGLM